MKLRLPFLSALLLIAPCHLLAQGAWMFQENAYGLRTISIKGMASFAEGNAPAELDFQCASGPSNRHQTPGNMLQFAVMQTATAASFHFDDFEGPDGGSGSTKALRVRVMKNGKAAEWAMGVGGGYSDADSFRFEVFSDANRKSVVWAILKAIQDHAESIEIEIQDLRNPTVRIKASFPCNGADVVVQKYSEGRGPK
ncbi:MAG TPA: hypothetical protein VL181_05280 [Holophagaceae bacterium]|jgi:hypothetical protein|nr:hypothetical protein [Holophagaceae bacterium]